MNEADPSSESTPRGEPMPEADPSSESDPHGEPMPEADPPIATHVHGDPMTQPLEDIDPEAETLRSLTPEDSARAGLTGVTCELGDGELRVLTRIAERLRSGMTAYGPLRLETDTRQFRTKEAREELEDALVSLAYLACAGLKTETDEVNR